MDGAQQTAGAGNRAAFCPGGAKIINPAPAALLALALAFASCAGSPRRISPGGAVPGLEKFISQIKNNDREVKKYFLLDSDSRIILKGTAGGFEAVYDMARATLLEDGRVVVPFSVEGEPGGLRHVLLWTPAEDDAGLLLSFDDDYQADWEAHFDLFDRYGAGVTFFLIGDFTPFCLRARERGHDIGYHTARHLNLRTVTLAVFLEETLGSLEVYRRAGIPLSSFAYPFGFSEPWMREILAGSFAVQRGFGANFRVYNAEAVKEGYLVSVSIDNILYESDEGFEAALGTMLRTVKFLGGGSILPLTTHAIAGDAQWGIKPGRLEYLLQSGRKLGLKFYRYCDF
ncbi:MAG: polysaccharide deacetylase family protein [Spirochaetaceae bacterium]|jgi:peptidoglycan/xylan/chitin deacetylase (PgdA/CDA1 family)|nr:polysaccharide deacetylase family protein [Spirochaetaceae bacterium]